MKKILSIILALAMMLCFAACGESTTEAQPAAETESTVKTVQAGKLIMGTNAAFPPYEFISDDGSTIVGIDAEIAELIASELGLELVIEDMEFSSIISAVQAGKIDIGMAGMTVTEERLKNVNFSTSYSTGVQAVIVPVDSPITCIDDLYNGAMIGVQESTTGHIYCEGDFGADNVIAYAKGPMAVQALVTGQVDCVVIDSNPAQEFVKANEGLKLLDTEYTVEEYAAAISKDNVELLDAFNEVLEAKIADGTVQSIIDKYINAD